MECQRMRCKEAAKLLGMSLAKLHALMDRKLIDVGIVIQPKAGKKNREYIVYKPKVYKLMGLDEEMEETEEIKEQITA